MRLDFSVVFCGRRGRERRSAGREREREKRAGWEGFSSSPAFSLCSFVFLLPSEGEGESLVGRGGEGRVQCVTGVRVMFGFCVSFPEERRPPRKRPVSAQAVHFFFFFPHSPQLGPSLFSLSVSSPLPFYLHSLHALLWNKLAGTWAQRWWRGHAGGDAPAARRRAVQKGGAARGLSIPQFPAPRPRGPDRPLPALPCLLTARVS